MRGELSAEYLALRKDGVKDLHNNELIKACRDNKALLDDFLIANREFIISILTKYKGNLQILKSKFKVEEEELLQVAYIGVISSLKEFDFNRGVKFTTFVVRPILWEINQFLYNDTRLVRLSRSAINIFKRIKEVEDTLEYLPDVDELAKILNVPQERVIDTLKFAQEIACIDDEPGISYTKVCTNTEEETVGRMYIQELINEAGLSDFESDIVRLVTDIDFNNSKIAELLGVYPMTVNRTIRRIREKFLRAKKDGKRVSKYENEIKILKDEMLERSALLPIDDVSDILDLCGFDLSGYTKRVLYYIRHKAIQSVPHLVEVANEC